MIGNHVYLQGYRGFESRPLRKDSESYTGVGQFGGQNELPSVDDASARLELTGVVETALAHALMLAAEAGRWKLVEEIAAELRVRSESRTRRRCDEPIQWYAPTR
jgi:hypothetical protein